RRDVELLQRLLHRPDHLHDVAFGDRPRCPTRTIFPVILAWPPAMTTPYFVSSSLRRAATSRPSGGKAEVTVFDLYPSCAKSWNPSAWRPAWVARARRAWRS